MAQVDMKNSHYLNERNRIFPNEPHVPWIDRDADYNIREGLTFGENEEETLAKQDWISAENYSG